LLVEEENKKKIGERSPKNRGQNGMFSDWKNSRKSPGLDDSVSGTSADKELLKNISNPRAVEEYVRKN
jgi:hypothetical protein